MSEEEEEGARMDEVGWWSGEPYGMMKEGKGREERGRGEGGCEKGRDVRMRSDWRMRMEREHVL